jgi:hypothetical protein
MSDSEENKKETYILINLTDGKVKVDAECQDNTRFLSVLGLMKPVLYEAVLAAIEDRDKSLLLHESLIKNRLVVRPSKVFGLGEKK